MSKGATVRGIAVGNAQMYEAMAQAIDKHQVASAYDDGKLGSVDGADALSVIRLDRSSLPLLRLDPETGLLDRVNDFAFDGVLPEAAIFDNSSRYLAVTNFDYFDPKRTGGSIDFWRIAGDRFDPKRTELVKMDFSIPVTRGAHSMAIVR